jgi:hypothetical protein
MKLQTLSIDAIGDLLRDSAMKASADLRISKLATTEYWMPSAVGEAEFIATFATEDVSLAQGVVSAAGLQVTRAFARANGWGAQQVAVLFNVSTEQA